MRWHHYALSIAHAELSFLGASLNLFFLTGEISALEIDELCVQVLKNDDIGKNNKTHTNQRTVTYRFNDRQQPYGIFVRHVPWDNWLTQHVFMNMQEAFFQWNS